MADLKPTCRTLPTDVQPPRPCSSGGRWQLADSSQAGRHHQGEGAALGGCLVLPASSGNLYRYAMIVVMQALCVFIRAISPVHRGLARSDAIVIVDPRRRRPRWHGLALHLQPRPAAPPRDQVKPGASQARLAATHTRTYVHTHVFTCTRCTRSRYHECTRSHAHTYIYQIVYTVQTRTHTNAQILQITYTHARAYTNTIRYMHVHLHIRIQDYTYAYTHISTALVSIMRRFL